MMVDRRAAGDGAGGAAGAGMEHQLVGALTMAAGARPHCQRRRPRLLGMGVGPHRPRGDDGDRIRPAGGVASSAWSVLGQLSGAALHHHAGHDVLHLGRDLHAVPVDPRATGSARGTRTSNYSFLYTAKGVAAILGGGLAVENGRSVRELVRSLLCECLPRADGVPDGADVAEDAAAAQGPDGSDRNPCRSSRGPDEAACGTQRLRVASTLLRRRAVAGAADQPWRGRDRSTCEAQAPVELHDSIRGLVRKNDRARMLREAIPRCPTGQSQPKPSLEYWRELDVVRRIGVDEVARRRSGTH